MLSAMATDMIDKQAALDDALARLEASERRVENLKFRYQEAEASRQRLEGDNAELRRLLHEERNADPAAGLQALGGEERGRVAGNGTREGRRTHPRDVEAHVIARQGSFGRTTPGHRRDPFLFFLLFYCPTGGSSAPLAL